MATFPQSCDNNKKFFLIAAISLLSVVSTIHLEKLANAIAAPPSISPIVQHDERDAPQAAFRVARANECPHKIDSRDVHGPNKDWHTGGWAVRQLCSQPVDTLFFVHAGPSHWENRINLRATLFEEAARAAFNWTGVFFIGQHVDPLVNLWTKLEAKFTGDVVIFPHPDNFSTIINKFVRGMRWVTQYCPKVRNIVKIDHDVGVQPFELRRYLDEKLPLENGSISCLVWKYARVSRDARDKHCIPVDDLPMDFYPHYCCGRAMIMTTDTMKKLYRASKFVNGYQMDDTYVSGHLAMLANVGHVDIGSNMSFDTWDVNTERMLKPNAMFTHDHSAYGNSVGRRAQWELMIWMQMTEAPGRHGFNSSYRLVDQMYRRVFHETRRALGGRSQLPPRNF
ncbi:hypothetical protein HPB52_009729 [Rhipicephalus sanguineus]|uniref:Hexosyltransferase n=1 Tax=Rhipicephalus sanguineus TaxID=34632 RepID=A0A9D4PWH6_RHISA|nr:hypothetical protein HPB52_009729 [Rhipicephalus sanguineus]